MTPKISVIIPVYNVESYLRQCLDSVVNQTMREIEIICVNDGSTDSSGRILDEYAARDDRFVIINQENAGQSVARNKGIRLAKGEYIVFLDSDDWFDVTLCEKAYNRAKESNADIVSFGFDCVRGTEHTPLTMEYLDSHSLKNVLLRLKNRNSFWNVIWDQLYRTTFLRDNQIYFLEGIIFEDNHFGYKCSFLTSKIVLLPESLYNYRWGNGYATDPKQIEKKIRYVETYNAMVDDFQSMNASTEVMYFLLQNKLEHLRFTYCRFSRALRRKFQIIIKSGQLPCELELIRTNQLDISPCTRQFFLSIYGNFRERTVASLKLLKYNLADWLAKKLFLHSDWLQQFPHINQGLANQIAGNDSYWKEQIAIQKQHLLELQKQLKD